MSQAQAESVIRNIICELVQRCASHGNEVSETLAAFMIKAVVLDPRNGFDVDRTLTPHDVQKLTEICLQRLTERCSPFLDTVKMQVYFDLNYTTRSKYISNDLCSLYISISSTELFNEVCLLTLMLMKIENCAVQRSL
uniref:Cilia- and flagella-associated protein 206 n=1 Tax=Periophthalmus magnuspinnatus TaxID=409849 RepID=A0A3B4B5W4_9GOBI